MKHLRFMAWGLALAAPAACVNLDEQLVGTVTTTFFTTPAGLEAALDGDYAQLRDFFGREESFAVTEFGTDLTTHGDQGGYQFENTYAAGLNASAGHYQSPWTSFYRGINTSNTVIERAPAVTGMDAAVKASRIAEAKFLRALSYFWLVQMYGPAPLPLTESQVASNQAQDRKSTRLNSSHSQISYAVFCLKKKKKYHKTALNTSTRSIYTNSHMYKPNRYTQT